MLPVSIAKQKFDFPGVVQRTDPGNLAFVSSPIWARTKLIGLNCVPDLRLPAKHEPGISQFY